MAEKSEFIDGVKLSTRATNCLINEGIGTLAELGNVKWDDLLHWPNMGLVTAVEIAEASGIVFDGMPPLATLHERLERKRKTHAHYNAMLAKYGVKSRYTWRGPQLGWRPVW